MLNISDPSHFAQCHISFKQNTSSVPLICEKLKRKRSLNPLYPFLVCFVQIISKESDMNATPRAAPRVILVFHSPLVSALFYFCCNFRSLNFVSLTYKINTSPIAYKSSQLPPFSSVVLFLQNFLSQYRNHAEMKLFA